MNKIVLSIGSNSDEAIVQMNNCIEWLSTVFDMGEISHVYETPALNGKDKNYLNAVFVGYVDKQYEVVRNMIKQYEHDSGRNQDSKLHGVVPIDIDVVMWNDEVKRNDDFAQSYFQIGWNAVNKHENS